MTQNPHNPELPYFECRPLDISEFKTAAIRFVTDIELDVTPARLFEILEDDVAWTVWVLGIGKVEWTTPKPFGPGTKRTVTFTDGTEVYETFPIFRAGKEMAFYFTGTSKLIWKWFGEHYEVTDLGGGRCRLRWTMVYEPAGNFARFHFLVKPLMKQTLAWYMRRLRKYCRAHPA